MQLCHQARELVTRMLEGYDLLRYRGIFGAELFKIVLNGFNQRAIFMADQIDQPIEIAIVRAALPRNDLDHTVKAFGM